MAVKGNGRIPRYIDAPVTIFIWPVDIFIPAFIMVVIGVLVKQFFMFLILSFLYTYSITLYQKLFPRGITGNVLHTIGVYPYTGYPDGYTKIFRG